MLKNRYSFSELLKTGYSLILTKLTMPQARLIRRPVYMRGGVFSINGAVKLTTGRFCRFDLKAGKKTLHIGEGCEFGDMTHIVALEKVVIGSHVLMASKVFVSDTNHGIYKGAETSSPHIPPRERALVSTPTVIGNHVWIGENAVILAGAEIGDGCVIGANSVITKKIPPNSIVAGTNRILRQYAEGVSGIGRKVQIRSHI